jgi:hypothetical protein
LAVRSLNWDEAIDEHDVDTSWADPAVLNLSRSRPGHGNDNEDCKSEDDNQGSEKGTRQRM